MDKGKLYAENGHQCKPWALGSTGKQLTAFPRHLEGRSASGPWFRRSTCKPRAVQILGTTHKAASVVVFQAQHGALNFLGQQPLDHCKPADTCSRG